MLVPTGCSRWGATAGARFPGGDGSRVHHLRIQHATCASTAKLPRANALAAGRRTRFRAGCWGSPGIQLCIVRYSFPIAYAWQRTAPCDLALRPRAAGSPPTWLARSDKSSGRGSSLGCAEQAAPWFRDLLGGMWTPFAAIGRETVVQALEATDRARVDPSDDGCGQGRHFVTPHVEEETAFGMALLRAFEVEHAFVMTPAQVAGQVARARYGREFTGIVVAVTARTPSGAQRRTSATRPNGRLSAVPAGRFDCAPRELQQAKVGDTCGGCAIDHHRPVVR